MHGNACRGCLANNRYNPIPKTPEATPHPRQPAPPPSTVPGNWVDAGSSGCLGKILTALPSTLAQTEHCNIPKGFITSLPLIISVEFLQGINMIYEIISHCICIAIVTNLIPQQLQKYCVVFWLYISAVFVFCFSAMLCCISLLCLCCISLMCLC